MKVFVNTEVDETVEVETPVCRVIVFVNAEGEVVVETERPRIGTRVRHRIDRSGVNGGMRIGRSA